ncbi:DUF362 domain-containing protein [Anaeroselena agilis]|uniref:DUF362 domain-containing protein n=1 Tax=Anaeroselena agilis TaxID=3063788 RepID=A0ABU3P4X7_9FIRM|nr:DUF362 domain-containing protein [Selenomonadales bacterium 4137-cl]
MNRRDFLRMTALAGLGAALLPGCAPTPAKPAPRADAGVGRTPAAAAPPGGSGLVVAEGTDPADMLARGLAALGGIGTFVKPGATVVLKPNFSVPRTPEEAATTNVALVGALVRSCLAAGAKTVKVIDYPFTNPVICLEKTGMKAAVAAAGGRVYTLNGGRDKYFKPVQVGGQTLAAAEYSKDVLEADVFINMPILKHHNGTRLTLGMKNLMGLVWDRGYFHRTDLHRCIAETAAFKKPHLTIMDALRGITDNGPMGPGPIREYNKLVFGTDPVAVDAYGATLFGMKPAEVDYIRIATELGVGQMDLGKVTVRKA